MLMSAGSSFATSCGAGCDFHLFDLESKTPFLYSKKLMEKELTKIDTNMSIRQLYTHLK